MLDKTLYSPLEVKELLQHQKSVTLVDVRNRVFYEEAHIPGAINIPELFTYLSESSVEGLFRLEQIFQERFSQAGVSNEAAIITYEDCLDQYYGSSCRGYMILNYLGHTNVSVMEGGFAAWMLAGLPVTTEVIVKPPATFTVTPNHSLFVTKEEMLAALNNPAITILDDRDKDEWLGKSSSPYGVDFAPRKGRIPGAKWIEWYEFMDRHSAIATFKSKADILALCYHHELHPDDNLIIYCFKGSRASNTYVALKKAGFKNVRVYFASWNEWSRHPELPIEEGDPAAI